MRFFLIPFSFFILLGCSKLGGVSNEGNRSGDQYLILISIDGFRYDYARRYDAKNIITYFESGVEAEGLIPGYPSKTFPNHYSIVTGLYPDNHGVVSNLFFSKAKNQMYSPGEKSIVTDGSWYGGKPIWVLAELNGIKSACYFWVGSEAEIKGIRPSYYIPYDGSVNHKERIAQVIDWLRLPEIDRPRLISLYFSLVDDYGHRYGPESDSIALAVQQIDNDLKTIVDGVSELNLPVNFIVVSDHGMSQLDVNNPIYLEDYFDPGKLKVATSDVIQMYYHDDNLYLDSIYNVILPHADRFSIYKKDEIPDYLHFGKNENVGDLLLIAKPPYVFTKRSRTPSPGTHGFDPYKVKDMQGIFYAWGPGIKDGLKIPAFKNIHIYPVLANLLKLPYNINEIDSDTLVLKDILE